MARSTYVNVDDVRAQLGLRQLPLQRRDRRPVACGPELRRHGRRLRRLRPGNWFLAIQSADGQVMIPSFHRPAIIRIRSRPTNDRQRLDRPQPVRRPSGTSSGPTRRRGSSARARPTATTPPRFPDLMPDPTTGQINYDVDNDGDGITDSVWLDLGYPARRDSQRPALQAAVRVHGHRPERPDPAQHGGQPGRPGGGRPIARHRHRTAPAADDRRRADHALHLGNSVSEVDPTYALQNGFDADVPAICWPRSPPPQLGVTRAAPTHNSRQQHAGGQRAGSTSG